MKGWTDYLQTLAVIPGQMKGLASKETVVLRRWESEK